MSAFGVYTTGNMGISTGRTGTGQPRLGQPSGTRNESTARASAPAREPAGLTGWLASAEAKRLEGRWVLLTDDFEVVDSAFSPSELLDRHEDDRTPLIVFVDPSNVNLAV